jgi:hypothetical protein
VVFPTCNPKGLGLSAEKAVEQKIKIAVKTANPMIVFFIFDLSLCVTPFVSNDHR